MDITDIHSWSFAYRIQSTKNRDAGGVIQRGWIAGFGHEQAYLRRAGRKRGRRVKE
jgi:hypothetical protein